jgi:hypothetical protein
MSVRKLYPFLKWVWTVPLLGWVVASAVRACSSSLFQHQVCDLGKVLDFVEANGFWLFLTLLVFGGLTLLAWRDKRHQEAREGFALLKPAKKLSPEDLDFRIVKSGEPVSQDARPFYEAIYVSRVAVPYHERVEENQGAAEVARAPVGVSHPRRGSRCYRRNAERLRKSNTS